MDAMQILVIILSIILALFLILAIVLVVQLIRVTKQIRMIATTTQSAVERVSNFAGTASKFVSPAIIARFVGKQFKKYKNSTKETK